MRAVIVHDKTEAELIEAADYLDRQCAGLGGAFLAEFDAVVKKIRTMPQMFPSFGVAFVIALEMRKPSYHGIGWKRINPDLRAWWENQSK